MNLTITPCKTGVVVSLFEKGHLQKTFLISLADHNHEVEHILRIAQPEARN